MSDTCHTDLVPELVAWKAQDYKPVGISGLQLVQLAVVPGGCSSERGHVLNQDHSPSVDVEIDGLPLQGRRTEIVEGLSDEGHNFRGKIAGTAA